MHSQYFLASLPRDDRHGAPSRNNRLEILPPSSDATTMLLYQFLERDTHLFLHHTRIVNMPANAIHLCARIPLPAKTSKPLASSSHDCRRHRDSLDIRHCRRAPEQPDISREGGLEPRLPLLPLEGLDERRLLTTDVRAGSTMEIDIEVVTGSARVLADQPGFIGLLYRLFDVRCLLVKFAADIDVCYA